MEEGIRCFIAIELEAGLQAALSELSRRLQRAPLGRLGRWVAIEGIHLTLKFLGQIPTAQVPAIEQAIRAACRGVSPFEMAIGGVGCFPNAQRPRVIWVGVEEPSGALQRLQLAVERELSCLGFRPEGRAFTPHLTLARIRDQAHDRERAELGAWLRQQEVGRLGAMWVYQICLMRSVLQPTGAVYTRLAAVPLQPEEG